jgi:hypothetical protein
MKTAYSVIISFFLFAPMASAISMDKTKELVNLNRLELHKTTLFGRVSISMIAKNPLIILPANQTFEPSSSHYPLKDIALHDEGKALFLHNGTAFMTLILKNVFNTGSEPINDDEYNRMYEHLKPYCSSPIHQFSKSSNKKYQQLTLKTAKALQKQIGISQAPMF